MREFIKNTQATMLGFFLGLFIIILIGASLIVTVANESAVAAANADITGTPTASIVELWPLLFAVIPAIILMRAIR